MNTAAQNISKPNTATSSVGSMAKEQMGGDISTKEIVQSVSSEVQPQKEVLDAGMQVLHENITVPPDLRKMGVMSLGPSAPIPSTSAVAIVLPISDPQIVAGLHMQVYSAIRWLAEWCLRQLKKAHTTLKVIHGKVTRVPYRL